MAWETGTANGHLDLLDRLWTFLTTNPSLVAAGQQWGGVKQQMLYRKAWTGRIAFNGYTTNATTMPDAPPSWLALDYSTYNFKGTINIPAAGSYKFYVDSRGPASVYIDGTNVTARTTDAASGVVGNFVDNAFSNAITLTAGNHELEIRYVNESGMGANSALALGWLKPGDASPSIVPAGNLSNIEVHWQPWGVTLARPGSAADTKRMTDCRYLHLIGPGMDGSKAIHVEITSYNEANRDYANWLLKYGIGTAFQDTGAGVLSPSNGNKWMPLATSPLKYWFVANGQRFIVVAKVSTLYISCYCGFFLPYATPQEYPYPIMIGASAGTNIRYTDTAYKNFRSFWHPKSESAGDDEAYQRTSLSIRMPSGSEMFFDNDAANSNIIGGTYPYRGQISYRPAIEGEYVLTPIILFNTSRSDTYGELDGIYHVNGYSIQSEDVVTIGGVDHLVVQSANMSGSGTYAAIRLE